jgi:hypothetical protein
MVSVCVVPVIGRLSSVSETPRARWARRARRAKSACRGRRPALSNYWPASDESMTQLATRRRRQTQRQRRSIYAIPAIYTVLLPPPQSCTIVLELPPLPPAMMLVSGQLSLILLLLLDESVIAHGYAPCRSRSHQSPGTAEVHLSSSIRPRHVFVDRSTRAQPQPAAQSSPATRFGQACSPRVCAPHASPSPHHVADTPRSFTTHLRPLVFPPFVHHSRTDFGRTSSGITTSAKWLSIAPRQQRWSHFEWLLRACQLCGHHPTPSLLPTCASARDHFVPGCRRAIRALSLRLRFGPGRPVQPLYVYTLVCRGCVSLGLTIRLFCSACTARAQVKNAGMLHRQAAGAGPVAGTDMSRLQSSARQGQKPASS